MRYSQDPEIHRAIAETVEALTRISEIQSEVINELMLMLLQHEDVREEDLAGIKAKIDEAAGIGAEAGI